MATRSAGTTPPRLGNRHPVHVPQGVFRCTGEDGWIVLSVTSDTQWHALCALLGREELAGLDADARREREGEIDSAIAAWTQGRDVARAMAALQAVGVPAGIALMPLDLVSDPHLRARGFWREADNLFMGRHLHASAPYREAGIPYPLRRPSPMLGQHNAEVLGRLLGLDGSDIERLTAAGVIGTVAVVKA